MLYTVAFNGTIGRRAGLTHKVIVTKPLMIPLD